MRHRMLIAALLGACASLAAAQPPPLLPEASVAALANELSGEIAKRNLEGLAQLHRQRGSRGFHSAAELVAARAREYGLSDVEILQFPADGKIYYGTQRSRQAWDASVGELMEIRGDSGIKLASYAAQPIVLAEDSESADVTAALIDVGDGSQESDYADKDVKGKIVLAAAQAGDVQDLAVGKFGAAGIVSYAQNQKTAWSGENDILIRWGHLESFSPNKTFAFMVSLKTARGMQERLHAKESIRLHAVVVAGQHPAFYEVVTALIPGADPHLKDQEIAFSCHLDHQRPGANDNASGCVTILEVARTLQTLIGDGKLARPARSIRFIWPPEVEGTVTLLNARPEFAQRIKAVVHMDMVGGGPETKAVFHVTRGPMSLPSFVHDVAWAFADWVNRESYKFAASGAATYPLIAPEGGREPLSAMYSAFSMGSDHEVYQDSSFAIPAIYMNDWPDRYIHTNLDTAANIDTTKLKRAALIGAASGYFLANLSPRDLPAAGRAIASGKLLRAVTAIDRQTAEGPVDEYERGVLRSLDAFVGGAPARSQALASRAKGEGSQRGGAIIYTRRAQPRGPLTVFGYDYFADHAEATGAATPKLLSYAGSWGAGEEYAYEALNFADGRHSAQQIADQLSAEYGPVPTALVIEYLQALQRINLLE
ncbi:MAG: M28 family peptidase [Gammaproteobacteria bacterium]